MHIIASVHVPQGTPHVRWRSAGCSGIARRIVALVAVTVFAGCASLHAQPDDQSSDRGVDARAFWLESASAYSETFPWDGKMHDRNIQFARVGVDTFFLSAAAIPGGDLATTAFWPESGHFGDEAELTLNRSLQAQAKAILAVEPDARFIVRWGPIVPQDWTERHPDHMGRAKGHASRRASLASQKALKGLAEMNRRIVRYCESAAWGGDRIVGYAMYPLGEGLTELACEGYLFDRSPVMRTAYRMHLREKYTDDAQLQAAWNDPEATLGAVDVPTMAQWRNDRKQWLHWPEPTETRRYRDYFEFVRALFFERVRTLVDSVHEASTGDPFVAYDGLKQPMLGWVLPDAFSAAGHGMNFPSMHLASGSIDVAPLLDLPALDAIVTPVDYTARSAGFGFEPEGLADPLILRGKAMLIEDDARSWVTNERSSQGAWRNAEEARVGLLRNTSVSFSRGLFNYWMNVGGGYFDDLDIMHLIEQQVPMRRALLDAAAAPHTEHAVAMIIDDTSPMWENFTAGFQHLAVLRQRIDELALTGIPYRIHLLSDLERADFPRFRVYLFPNLFQLTPECIALIREKCFRDGAVVIFGPGTGITDGQTRRADFAAELMGIPLELVEKSTARRVLIHANTHPAVAHVNGAVAYGDSFVYGPVLQPATDLGAAVELGKASMWFGSNRAGLVLRAFGKGAASNGRGGERGQGDAAAVFSVATPMPAELLRSLALYAGCNPWGELGDVIAANGRMLAVHSVRPGTRTLRLPAPMRVTELTSGGVTHEAADHFKIQLDAPATRVFRLDEPR